MIEPAREVTVRVQDLRHGAGACVVTRRWPLRTLVAYLFEGRECDEVRALLARGRARARGDELTWPPLELAPEELTAVERTFPPARPDRPLDPGEVTAVALHLPLAPHDARPEEALAIRRDHPLLRAAAERAAYAQFDYGPWADLYSATLGPDEVAAWVAAAAEPTSADEEVQLVIAPAGTSAAWVDFVAPRAGERAPWRELPP